jgi:hypothetical protein
MESSGSKIGRTVLTAPFSCVYKWGTGLQKHKIRMHPEEVRLYVTGQNFATGLLPKVRVKQLWNAATHFRHALLPTIQEALVPVSPWDGFLSPSRQL